MDVKRKRIQQVATEEKERGHGASLCAFNMLACTQANFMKPTRVSFLAKKPHRNSFLTIEKRGAPTPCWGVEYYSKLHPWGRSDVGRPRCEGGGRLLACGENAVKAL